MSNTADGTITIGTKIDTKGLKSGMNSIEKSLKSLSGLVAKVFAITAVVKFAKAAMDLASDLNEVQNVVDTAFGDMSYKIEEFSKTCVEKFGLSELSAKQMSSTFMAMSSAMGQARDVGSDMAVELTGRLGDIASFYNKDIKQLDTIGRAIYSGETEPLKQLGVIMTEDSLSAYALANGYKTLYKNMSASEKLLVRQKYFLEQTSLAAGDFEKTQDSWANQTRILSENWKVFLSVIGSGLITVLTPLLKMLNEILSSLINITKAAGDAISKLFGLKKQTLGTASGAQELSEAENEVAESVSGAGKAAKKTLSTFDELNNISSTSGGGASTAGAGLSDIGSQSEAAEEEVSELESMLDKMKSTIEKMASLFRKGFMEGLGDSLKNLDKIKKSFESIKSSIQDIFTDKSVQDSFVGMVDKFVYAAGQLSGSFVSVGITIATNIIEGISKYLDKNKGFIKDKLSAIFTNTGNTYAQIGDFSVASADIFSVFSGDNATTITSDLITIFSNAFLEIVELSEKFGYDLVRLFTQPIIDNSEGIKAVLDEVLGSVAELTTSISEGLTETFIHMSEVYDEKVRPMFDNLTEGLSNIVSVVVDVWMTQLLPIFDSAIQKVIELWEQHLQPFLIRALDLFGSIAEFLGVLFNTVLVPLISWIIEKVVPPITNVLNTIFGVVVDIFGDLVDFLESIFQVIQGVVEVFTAILTGDWSKLWEGIKNIVIGVGKALWSIVKGIFDTLVGIFKTAFDIILGAVKIFVDAFVGFFEMIWNSIKAIVNVIRGGVEWLANCIIKALNFMIGALNKLSFDVPDWVPGIGGKKLGFNIPTISEVNIPRLADGAVIPPNREFMAVLGDQKSGTNIEAPLDTIKQALSETMNELGLAGNGDIVVQIDGYEVFRAVRNQNNIFKKSTGINAFT